VKKADSFQGRSIDRRRLIGSGLMLAAAAASTRLRAAPEQADVIIIGAGMAGLTAAITLADEGAKVLVLEADTEVGGRMRSISSPIGTLSPGATTVGPMYARVRNYINRFDVAIGEPVGRAGMGIAIGDTLINSADWESSELNPTVGDERAMHPRTLENRLLTADLPLSEPFDWLGADALALDQPIADYLLEKGASPGALELIDITINANNLENASALMYLRDVQRLAWAMGVGAGGNRSLYQPGAGGRFAYIKGGTGRLPEAMAAHLGDRVRLGAPVIAVDQDPQGIEVTTLDGSRYRAAQLVCSAPLAVVRDIRWQPALTGELGRLVYSSNNTATSHVYFAVEKPFWDEDIGEAALFTDSPLERVFAAEDYETGEVAYLDCWINGRMARQIDSIPRDEVEAFATGVLNRIRPSTKGRVRFAGTYSWGLNPYIRGNKHEWAPGQMPELIAALEQDTGRIQFAGEHFRVAEPGMEGAAESGERAALRILEA
jgi:monoamine oxidase